jgi:predicted NBD/HSP70 family sugar kinase
MNKEHGESSRTTSKKAESHHEQTAHETSAEQHPPDADLKQKSEQKAQDVFSAFRKGQKDAIEAAERTLPAVKQSVSKGTYMLCYYLSFGAVYTAELAMGFVPEDSVIRNGFKDGAAAAQEAHAQRKASSDAVPAH